MSQQLTCRIDVASGGQGQRRKGVTAAMERDGLLDTRPFGHYL